MILFINVLTHKFLDNNLYLVLKGTHELNQAKQFLWEILFKVKPLKLFLFLLILKRVSDQFRIYYDPLWLFPGTIFYSFWPVHITLFDLLILTQFGPFKSNFLSLFPKIFTTRDFLVPTLTCFNPYLAYSYQLWYNKPG